MAQSTSTRKVFNPNLKATTKFDVTCQISTIFLALLMIIPTITSSSLPKFFEKNIYLEKKYNLEVNLAGKLSPTPPRHNHPLLLFITTQPRFNHFLGLFSILWWSYHDSHLHMFALTRGQWTHPVIHDPANQNHSFCPCFSQLINFSKLNKCKNPLNGLRLVEHFTL